MSYKVKIGDTEQEINSSYPNIAYSTNLISDVKFNPSTTYNNLFQGMSNNENYISTGNGALNNKWGKVPVIPKDKYSNNGSELLFADSRSCPIIYRPINISKTNALDMGWGDIQWSYNSTTSHTIIYKYDKSDDLMKVSTDGGVNFSTASNFPTINGKAGHSLLFIELVGGGGSGGGCNDADFWTDWSAGGGGGAGAYCQLIVDMSIASEILITLGKGGNTKEGGEPTSGGASTIYIKSKTANNYNPQLFNYYVQCGGGTGGARGAYIDAGSGGSGGECKDNLPSNDTLYASAGIMQKQVYNGKGGGAGGRVNSAGVREESLSGGSFISSDQLYNPLADNIYLIDSNMGKGGTTSSDSFTDTMHLTAAGGGGGASAIANGNCQKAGAGGRGNNIYKDGSEDSNTDSYVKYNTDGQKGGDGCCIIHYNFHA